MNMTPPLADSGKPYLQIVDVVKQFGEHTAVNGVNLTIGKNEIFALLGSSGCGKSTLLRMLAGMETPTSGRILLDGQDVTRLPPYERPINMMFQSYALFPHMTVEQNIAFGLRQDKLSKADINERVARMLELVQMSKYARRKPFQLSGGQQQRVALARSLAKRPKLLLLDEPLGALDGLIWSSASARTIIVMVWLPELPPMPATIGMSAASATSFWIEPSNTPITREATKAVTRLIASHAQRLRSDFHTEAKMSSSSRRPKRSRTSASLSSRITSSIASTVTRPMSLPCASTTGAVTRS